jgi:hypothetical protein
MSELREYRCTRNALYSHDCTGRDDLRERQGHYIMACSADEAWEKMAIRYPEEAVEGFTVQEWHGSNVRVFKVDRISSRVIVDRGMMRE